MRGYGVRGGEKIEATAIVRNEETASEAGADHGFRGEFVSEAEAGREVVEVGFDVGGPGDIAESGEEEVARVEVEVDDAAGIASGVGADVVVADTVIDAAERVRILPYCAGGENGRFVEIDGPETHWQALKNWVSDGGMGFDVTVDDTRGACKLKFMQTAEVSGSIPFLFYFTGAKN